MHAIEKEITDLTKTVRKEGEEDQAYFFRLQADSKSKINDELWETLSDETQNWLNEATGAAEAKQPIANFDGVVSEGSVAVEPPKKEKKAKAKKEPKAEAAPSNVVELKPKAKKAKPEAKAKPEKAAKAAKANGKEPPAGKGRKPKFLDTGKIKILAKENPFRKGTKSEKWFDNYKNGMTVKAAIEAGTPRHHINWDVTLGNISIQ